MISLEQQVLIQGWRLSLCTLECRSKRRSVEAVHLTPGPSVTESRSAPHTRRRRESNPQPAALCNFTEEDEEDEEELRLHCGIKSLLKHFQKVQRDAARREQQQVKCECRKCLKPQAHLSGFTVDVEASSHQPL